MKMPVKFLKSSEYKESFYPHQSIKSASFVPAPEQAMRSAGVGSKHIGASFEPPMQRKKRSRGPPTSFSTDYYLEGPAADSYTLLGNQDKFASSIKYRTKNNNAMNAARDVSPPKVARDVSPPKQQKLHTKQVKRKEAPVVNTDKFKQPPTPLAPRKTKDVEAQLKDKVEVRNISPKEERKWKNVKESRKESEKEAYQKGKDAYYQRLMKIKEAPVVNTEEFKKPHESYKSKSMPSVEHHPEKGAVEKSGKEDPKHRVSKHESEQHAADVKKTRDVPDSYLLQYKAGLVPPRHSKKYSEYHKQFTWKEKIPSSPIIAAEEVVYKSNPQLKPYKADVIPKVTEYNAQFKSYDDDKILQQVIAEEKRNRRKRMKARSKSVGAVPRARPAGSSPVVTHDNKRLTKESDGVIVDPSKMDEKPAVPKVPNHHGKMRKVTTEYNSNFKSPTKFSYDKGAWKGADPPHVYQSKEPEQIKVEKPNSWFAEVVELRQKAQEYRKRAQGTHFSREHLVQVMAKQADLWDVESTCSTLSALSLESASTISVKQRNVRDRRSDFDSNKATIATETMVPEAWMDEDQSPDDETPRESCTATSERLSSCRSIETTEDEGRKPTPKLRDTSRTRHHFDRTTPVTGGALLSSPDINKRSPKKPAVSRSLPNFSAAREADQQEEEIHSYKPLAGQHAKTYSMDDIKRPFTTPTLGMPTRDYQALRDDDASVDRPLSTQFVHSPLKGYVPEEPESPDTSVLKSKLAAVKKSKSRPHYIPGTIKEDMGVTYNKPYSDLEDRRKERTMAWTNNKDFDDCYAYDDDDDILSVSARSIASSSSLASEVLERTKKRKEFWDRGNIASR